MTGIYVRFHGWRGFGLDNLGDFFNFVLRCGLVTVYGCRACPIDRLHEVREAVVGAQEVLEQRIAAAPRKDR